MSKEAHAEMTSIKGYFNPNPYRVTVMISEVGMTVELAPQEFILDRVTQRKINDPLLNRYVGRLLSTELTEKPVPVVKIPFMARTAPANPGYAVGQGKRDATGRWQPPVVASQPPVAASQPGQNSSVIVSSQGSVLGMSLEEARKRGFVGKQRLVSEDYGAAETDGAPTRGDAIPKIKYSMETVAPMARHSGPLPAELTEGVRPELQNVVQQLSTAANTDPETVSLNRSAAEKAVRDQQGEAGVKNFRQAAKAVKQNAQAAVSAVAKIVRPAMAPKPKAVVAAPIVAAPIVAAPIVAAPVAPVAKRTVAEVLPPVPIEELNEADDSPLMGGRSVDTMPPQGEEQAQPKPKPRPKGSEKEETVVCAACGKPFPFKSYYVRHIQRAHKDRLQELMPRD